MAETNSTVSGTVTFETDDDLSETNIGAADAQSNSVDYVERGCGFSVNHTNDTIDIGNTNTRGNYVIVENPSSHVAWHLYPDQATGIGLPNAAATNHVFIAYDESTDEISYHIDDDDTAPSEPSLKIGTVDTSADTSAETNRTQPIETHTIAEVSSDYTADTRDMVLADAASAVLAVTLPPPATDVDCTVKKIDSTANNVTLTPESGTIDGLSDMNLTTQYVSRTVVANATDYFIK